MNYQKRFLASSVWLAVAILTLIVPIATLGQAQEIAPQRNAITDNDYLAITNQLASGMNLAAIAESTFNAIPVEKRSLTELVTPQIDCSAIAARAAAQGGWQLAIADGVAMPEEYQLALANCKLQTTTLLVPEPALGPVLSGI